MAAILGRRTSAPFMQTGWDLSAIAATPGNAGYQTL
jgi:hypothetical protein